MKAMVGVKWVSRVAVECACVRMPLTFCTMRVIVGCGVRHVVVGIVWLSRRAAASARVLLRCLWLTEKGEDSGTLGEGFQHSVEPRAVVRQQ